MSLNSKEWQLLLVLQELEYDLSRTEKNMKVKELREHAKNKKLKITKNGRYLKKKDLLKMIEKYNN